MTLMRDGDKVRCLINAEGDGGKYDGGSRIKESSLYTGPFYVNVFVQTQNTKKYKNKYKTHTIINTKRHAGGKCKSKS